MSTTGDIDLLLSNAVNAGVAPGIAAIAADAERVLYRGAAGTRGDAPMSTDSVCWIASMTKLVTIIGALQLVERGSVSLDSPMAEILPELADRMVIEGFDADGVEILRPARVPLTFRHLLTHTAGFAYDFWSDDITRYAARHGVPGIIACDNATLANPLVAEPGSSFVYGTSTEWVGKVIETVSGLDLEQYIQRNIVAPIGLTDTGFRIGSRRARLARMNARTEDGFSTPIEVEVPQDPAFYMGGGGLYSTAEDYITLLQVLLAGGSRGGVRILGEDTIRDARNNHIGDLTVGPLKTSAPTTSYDVNFLPGATKKWSLFGLLNVEATPGGRSAGSLFWAGLSNCYFWVDWERGHAGALFTQMLPFADPKILSVYDRFEDAVRDLQV